MSTGKFRVVFYLPPGPKSYYRRHVECRRNGLPATKPEITTDVADAAKFSSPDLALTARRRFRADFPRYTVFIEDANNPSGPLVEPHSVAATEEDHRTPVFVEMDGYEHSGVGFIVRPVIRPSGERLWALRPQDCPSIVASQRHTALESAYGPDPVSTVKRAYELWGDLLQPFTPPEMEAQQTRELKDFVNEIRSQRRAGLRPGDQRS